MFPSLLLGQKLGPSSPFFWEYFSFCVYVSRFFSPPPPLPRPGAPGVKWSLPFLFLSYAHPFIRTRATATRFWFLFLCRSGRGDCPGKNRSSCFPLLITGLLPPLWRGSGLTFFFLMKKRSSPFPPDCCGPPTPLFFSLVTCFSFCGTFFKSAAPQGPVLVPRCTIERGQTPPSVFLDFPEPFVLFLPWHRPLKKALETLYPLFFLVSSWGGPWLDPRFL